MAVMTPVYASANAKVTVGKQRGPGYYNRRKTGLLPLLGTSLSPMIGGNTENTGIELGSGTNMEQADIKSSAMLSVQFQGHLRSGAVLNFLCALGYKPIVSGTPDTATPFAGATNRAHKAGHFTLEFAAATTGLAVGNEVQIGDTPVTPANTDNAEVHEVVEILASGQTQVGVITLLGAPTSGTWYAKLKGTTTVTAALAYNAAAAAVQAGLETLYGAGNVTVTGSAGGPYTYTMASALALSTVPDMEVNGDALAGGVGWGPEAGLGSDFYFAYVDHQITTEGTGANSVRLLSALEFNHASAEAVVRTLKTEPTTVQFWHVQSDDASDVNGYSMTVKSSNGSDTFWVHYFDGKAVRFDLQFQKGSVFTFNTEMKFADIVRLPANDVTTTTRTDRGANLFSSTRGTFDYLGNRKTAPTGLTMTLESEIPDDFGLFRYKAQSIVHTSHKVSMTSDGKFVLDISDKINFNGTVQATVSDVIPEYPVTLKFQSSKTIGTSGKPFSFALKATDVQASTYNPQFSTNQFATAQIGLLKVIPSALQAERWYFELVGLSTSDDFNAI